MKTSNPGIFIPMLSVDSNLSDFERVYNLILKSYKYERNMLQNKLAAAGIEAILTDAFRISEELGDSAYFGIFVQLEHAHQLEYQRALEVIKQETGVKIDEYTAPLGNIPASGVGCITSSVYAFIQDNGEDRSGGKGFKQNLALLQKILQKLNSFTKFQTELVINLADSGFEVHGTSPLHKESNNLAFAWQNYLGRAFKAVAPMIAPMFMQTWSTNHELQTYFAGKGREVSPEKQAEYARYAKK